MSEGFLTLTELGRVYGISSHKMGRWLVDLGLRTADKRPSTTAFQGGFVAKRDSTQPGTYFWAWHAEKTMMALDNAGYERATDAGSTAT